MNDDIFSKEGQKRIDESGYVFSLRGELSRGGQGVVYRTNDPELVIKQPIDPATGEIDRRSDMRYVFRNVRMLPLPEGINIALPLSVLKDGPDGPGYVMRLLEGMKSFENAFYLKGDRREELKKGLSPFWLEGADPDKAAILTNYAETGSTASRLLALAGCAAILGRLHSYGLVYCDVSPNNAFVDITSGEVWLIDADNLRYEQMRGGASLYTPRFGAPEVVRLNDSSRAPSDCWSFAVMAFEMLALNHPFIGKRVLEGDESGWDCEEPSEIDSELDLDERAYAGHFPFIDSLDDDTNEAPKAGIPRELVLTPMLSWLFQQTLNYGKEQPFKRTPASLWSMAMAQAYDQSLICPKCHMSYYASENECPYCESPKPPYLVMENEFWESVIQVSGKAIPLRHRFLNPFDLRRFNEATDYCIDIDMNEKSVVASRGYPEIPKDLAFEFRGVA